MKTEIDPQIQSALYKHFGLNYCVVLRIREGNYQDFGKPVSRYFQVIVRLKAMGHTRIKTVQIEDGKVIHVFRRNLKF